MSAPVKTAGKTRSWERLISIRRQHLALHLSVYRPTTRGLVRRHLDAHILCWNNIPGRRHAQGPDACRFRCILALAALNELGLDACRRDPGSPFEEVATLPLESGLRCGKIERRFVVGRSGRRRCTIWRWWCSLGVRPAMGKAPAEGNESRAV